MPLKRQVLEELKRDELIAAVERFELPAADKRVRDLLIDALASSRKATLAELLGDLKRDRLKELCRALGLDDGGREKALIIERLGGRSPAARSAPVQAKLDFAEEPSPPAPLPGGEGSKNEAATRRQLRFPSPPGRGRGTGD